MLPSIFERLKDIARPPSGESTEPPSAKPADASAPTGVVDWSKMPQDTCWIDRPDALLQLRRKLKSGEVSEENAPLIEQYIFEGGFTLSGAVDPADIDELNSFFEHLWSTPEAEDVTFLGFTLAEGQNARTVHHSEMVHLPREERLRLSKLSPWRIHGLGTWHPAARRIFLNERMASLSSQIFAKPAISNSTINFYYGSRQELHQDMAVFHIHPGNYLIGAWIALEDIQPDSGPLIYAKGSHHSPIFPEFDNFPQTTLRTVPLSVYPRYYQFTNDIAERHGISTFLGKKGDVFFWHGMLVHGGSKVTNPDATRRSMVIHYTVDGVNRKDKIVGPYHWS